MKSIFDIENYNKYLSELQWADAAHEDVCDGLIVPVMVEYLRDKDRTDVRYSFHKVAFKDVNISFYKGFPEWNKGLRVEITALARGAGYSLKQSVDGDHLHMIPAIINNILQYADEAKEKRFETTVSQSVKKL